MVNNEKPLLYEAAFLYPILHKKYRISQRGLCNVLLSTLNRFRILSFSCWLKVDAFQ